MKSNLLNCLFSFEDLAEARRELDRWNKAYADDRSNNPDKYQAQRRDAGIRVRKIEADLKRQGLLAKTESELLTETLDRLYPNARSRTVVTYDGKKYEVRYFPVVQSRSRKSVKEWGHEWVPLETS